MIVGGVMLSCSLLGGMIATTWVQIVKAVLLLGGATVMALLVLGEFGLQPARPVRRGVASENGAEVLQPGSLVSGPLGRDLARPRADVRDRGAAAHPDALLHRARRESGAHVGELGDDLHRLLLPPDLRARLRRDGARRPGADRGIDKGGNAAALLLAEDVGGTPFFGFIAAVAFATILAVVAGLTLSGAAALSHDVWVNVVRHGEAPEHEQLRVARIATFVMGALAIVLGIALQGQNIAFMVGLAFAIAASANFPALLMSIYWRGSRPPERSRASSSGAVTSLVLIYVLADDPGRRARARGRAVRRSRTRRSSRCRSPSGVGIVVSLLRPEPAAQAALHRGGAADPPRRPATPPAAGRRRRPPAHADAIGCELALPRGRAATRTKEDDDGGGASRAGQAIETMLPRGAPVPAGARVRGAGQRAARALRPRLRGALGARGPRARHLVRALDELLEWEPPYAKWYLGGKLNVCFNCVDRHVEAGRGDKVAYHWEGEPEGDRRELTYADLQARSSALANALKELGVRKGTQVAIYMGMVPEAARSRCSPARGWARRTRSSSAASPPTRSPAGSTTWAARCSMTQDEAWRRGSKVPLKQIADEAIERCAGHRDLRRPRAAPRERSRWSAGRDVFWNEVVEGKPDDPESCPCEPMDSEDLLFLMYTSGTTAKPKGIAHTTGGYLVGIASTHHYIFDLKRDDDVYWCAADIGWITGHSYIVYGPLANGATSVIYEGTPDFPDKDRWWDIVERYGVTILYTAPTAIRAHMKWGPEHAQKHDLSSLRLLGSVGEPINPEAWMWYREHIGGGRTPVVDTWWQTETGMIMITPLPGSRPRSRGRRPGRSPAWTRRSSTSRETRSGPAAGATSSCASRGRQCCAGSTATTSGTWRRTGRNTPVSTSQVTGRGSTRTATSGSWAVSTT